MRDDIIQSAIAGLSVVNLATTAALKLFPTAALDAGALAITRGGISAADGRSAIWTWAPQSTAVPDDCSVVLPVSGAGRWLRCGWVVSDSDIITGTSEVPGEVSAAQLRRAIERWGNPTAIPPAVGPVGTYAELSALKKPTGTEVCFVSGNGGGHFEWRPQSTVAANGGTVIAASTGGVGRWHRVGVGSDIDARWFGAACDGTTDDTQAITAARDAARSVASGPGCLLVPGNCRIGSVDLSGISICVLGVVRTAAGVMLTFGSNAQTGMPISVEIPRIDDGRTTMVPRTTPQVRITGRNGRYVLEAGYVQLYADGNNPAIYTAAWNVIEVTRCHTFEICGPNGGACIENVIHGCISTVLDDGIYNVGKNRFYGTTSLGGVHFGRSLDATLSDDVSTPLACAAAVESTTVTGLVRTIEVFDATGASIGFLPVYSSRA